MFGTIRMIFWIIIFVVSITLMTRYSLLQKRKHRAIFGILILILWILSMLIPVENLFITFSSPENAFNYVNSEEVKLVVSGSCSDLVIGEENEYVYLIVPKSDEGWKVGRGLDIKTISQHYKEGIVVYVYQYKNTDDYYVEVADIDGRQCLIGDNRNSKFSVLTQDLTMAEVVSYRYYCYVHDLDDTYMLNVNDINFNITCE